MKRAKSGKAKIATKGKKKQRQTPIKMPPSDAVACSVDQAAMLLQVGRVTVYNLLREKKLESCLIHERIRRVTMESIRRLAAGT
jgi:hypothetical protein